MKPVVTLMRLFLLIAVLACLRAATPARADSDGDATSGGPTEWQVNLRSAGNRPGLAASLREGPTGGIWQRSQLLGDPFGARSWLGRLGVSLSLQETSEALGNATGGTRTGFAYDGLTTLDLQIDTQRGFGLRGGLFNASALDVHGTNLSARNLSTLQTASGIEADAGFRLWELWYQQSFWFRQLDVKLGAQSLDQEFMVTQYGLLFVNTMFGWPALTSYDLLSGGPAYPLAALGARVRYRPMGSAWAFLLGVFDDNPSGIAPGSSSDPQRLDRTGTSFRLNDKPLAIFEIQYSRPADGEMQFAGERAVLPGTYKLGAWYDFGRFADQEIGTDGLSLADPASNGQASLHRGDFSIYAVVDQLLWRESDESPRGVGVFARVMGAPADRNQVAYSANAGVTLKAPLAHREYDAVGLGMGWANVGSRARAQDQDSNSFNAPPAPVRGSETFLEVTYQYQLVPWWQLQPDVQYVFNPGGGLSNPTAASRSVAIASELVMGLRTNISL